MKNKRIMDFGGAIDRVLDGEVITRLDWPEGVYGFLGRDGVLTIYLVEDGENHHWLVNQGDLEGIDYLLFKAKK